MQTSSSTATTPQGIVMLVSILTTVSSVYPAFLAGALGPELRSSIGISEGFFGLVIGSFFIGSALGSVALGRLGEQHGARRMITVSLLTTAAMTALIAGTIRSGAVLLVALFVAGIANSGGQTAANKLLSQSIEPGRLGFAMAIKQSGMPGATLLGGLAVPAIALTVGWPWAYAAASLLAIVALGFVLRFAPVDGPDVQRARRAAHGDERTTSLGPRPTPSTRSTLLIAAVAAYFSAAAAGTLGSWLTSSATDAGWSSGAAGLLLSVGSISGISARLVLGWQADRSRRLPMMTAAQFLALGALGALTLAPRLEWTHAVGALVAFGAGWSWPALFNFAIVRTNAAAAALATGITQTGVYLGVVTGPIVMGQLVERSGYQLGWTVAGSSMLVGAAIMSRVAGRFTDPATTTS
ncbi:MAG: MFS transporter [Acidimicrobiales bacterium]